MANPAFESVDPPFTTFRFEVVLTPQNPPAGLSSPLCGGAFAECDGLEMSMEPKMIQEGGNNGAQHHRIGPVRYSQLTLKRGMTPNLDLWTWFVAAAQPGKDRSAEGQVTMWSAEGRPVLTFVLRECLPVKLRAPALNARDGLVAVEELALVYAAMEVRPPGGAGVGFGVGISAGFGASVGASFAAGGSVGLSAGFSAGASASVSGGISGGISGGASLDFD